MHLWKKDCFVLKKPFYKSFCHLSSHRSLKERRVHRCQMHLSCYQNGGMGMSGWWSISGFFFWENGLVTDYMEESWKQSKGKLCQNTIKFSTVQCKFLANDKDNQRNLCPHALVLQLSRPSVLRTLFLPVLHCNLEQQNHKAEKKATNVDQEI